MTYGKISLQIVFDRQKEYGQFDEHAGDDIACVLVGKRKVNAVGSVLTRDHNIVL